MREPAPPAAQGPAPRHRQRNRHIPRWLTWGLGGLGTLVLLLAVLATLVVVAVQTERGTRLLWQTATRLAPGSLSGELIGGTLRDGLRLRNVVYRDASTQVRIDRLESEWRLLLRPLTLVVPTLRMGTAEVTLLPEPSPSRTPPQLPRQLTLPLAFELRNASLEQLLIRQGTGVASYKDIRLQASYDRVQHILTLEHAQTPYGLATGTLQLQGLAPFAIAGTVGLTGQYEGKYAGQTGEATYRLDTRLSGSLQALGIQVDARGGDLEGHADIEATPFAAVPIHRAQVSVRGLDPQAFNPQWPHAALELQAALTPTGDTAGELSQLTVTGPVSLRNAQAGAINRGLLPLESATMVVTLNARTQQLSELKIRLPGKATLVGKGEIHDTGQGTLALQAHGLNLHTLHTQLKPSQLSGPLAVQFAGDTQQVDLELASPSLSLTAQATLDPQNIALHTAQLRAGAARLTFSGSLARGAQAAYSASGSLRDFNPAQFFASVPQVKNRTARINADIDVRGALQPALSAKVQFKVHGSQYGGLPMTGGGTVHIVGKQLLPSDAQLSAAGNSLRLKGSFGKPSDRLALDIAAPALDRLGFGLSGLLQVHGGIGGTLDRPVIDAQYRAENLAFGAHRLAWLSGEAHTQGVPGTAPHARLVVDLNARGLQSGDIRFGQLTASIDGTYANHALRVSAEGSVHKQALQLTLAAQGRLHEQPQGMAWDGVLHTLENRTSPQVHLESPLPLAVGPGRIELGAGRLTVAKASIDLQSLVYRDALLRSEGSIRALDLGNMLALREQWTGKAPPFSTDLVLDGRWNVALAERADGFVEITRRSGDVRLTGQSTFGLQALSLRATLQGNQVALNTQVSATRLGTMDGEGQIGLLREEKRLTLGLRSPVSGRVTASIPNLQTIASLAGPRIALTGSSSIVLAVKGTLGEPLLSGTVAGDHLALTLYDQGVHLRDGMVRLRLENNIVELQQVLFRGGSGTLSATGHMALGGAVRGLNATIVASNLQLLAGPSAQMTVTGQAVASNANGPLLVSGKFIVDHGLFSLPEKPAPRLDGDVVVVRGGQAQTAARINRKPSEQPAGALTPHIDIELDLGEDFAFQGAGAELRLAGTLNLRSEPGATPQAFGSVRVVEGSYEAFGTELAIESGVINFQGSLNNPNVNLVAMRREQEVAAGVRVTGTVRRPRVQLVSEPNLPQEQQLSWLVFGRASGGGETGQAKAAVQGAALGLLNKFGTGRAAQSFGLDAFAIGESEFGLAGSQVVNLGKEISDRLYIGYEQSLAGAESVMKLIYTLTPQWSVVLRGGTVAGLDVLYSKRFDRLR